MSANVATTWADRVPRVTPAVLDASFGGSDGLGEADSVAVVQFLDLGRVRSGRQLLDAAEGSMEARLQEIDEHLRNRREVEQALRGVDLWMRELDRQRAARLGAKL